VSLRQRLKAVVESRDTRAARMFDAFIYIAILVSLVEFSIETVPGLPPDVRSGLLGIEVATVLIFTVEYLLRIYVSDNRLKFVLSGWGIVDLVAILPFYLSLGVDLRTLRILRFLRLARALKIGRYSKAVQLFSRAFRIARAELVLFLAAMLMLIYLSAILIYYFENEAQPEVFSSVFASLWWAVVTLTTVGYGDTYPITVGGKVFTFFILMIGLGTIAVPSGIVAAALAEARRAERSGGDA
jgi:voltage-gated potassium channel